MRPSFKLTPFALVVALSAPIQSGDLIAGGLQPPGEAFQLPMRSDTVSQIGVDVAAGSQGFLAVWMELRATGVADICGARIDMDGTLLDATPLVISDAAGDQILPKVAAYPGGYLVVWADTRNEASTVVDVYAARITAEGEVLDPGGLAIETAPGAQFLPHVACNGIGCFVVWQDGDGLTQGSGDANIRGTAVGLDGSVASTVPIAEAFLDQTRPVIAGNESGYLVVWNDIRSGATWDVRGARVRADGTLDSPSDFVVAGRPETDENFPAVGSNGKDYLALWEVSQGDLIGIQGRLVSADGGLLGEAPVSFSPDTGVALEPSVASTEGHFMVAWQEGIGFSFGEEPADVVAARLAGNGPLLDRSPHRLASNPNSEEMVALAGSGDQLIAAYQTGSGDGVFRVAAQIFEPSFPRLVASVVIDDPKDEFVERHADLKRVSLAALQDWGRYLQPPHGVIPALDIQLRFEPFASMGFTVAYAASEVGVTVGVEDGLLVYEEGVAHEVHTGFDPNGTEPDATITLNGGFVEDVYWYDPDPATRLTHIPQDRTRFDFYSVILHEFAHVLGMYGSLDQNGDPETFSISRFDRLVARDGENLLFVGETAKARYGGPVPLTQGNYLHVGNRTEPGLELVPDLMHSPTDCALGGRCFISSLDLAILKDTGLPIADSTAPPLITGLVPQADGTIALEWAGACYGLRVLCSPGLDGFEWVTCAENLVGTSAVLDGALEYDHLFFRLQAAP